MEPFPEEIITDILTRDEILSKISKRINTGVTEKVHRRVITLPLKVCLTNMDRLYDIDGIDFTYTSYLGSCEDRTNGNIKERTF